MKILYGVQGTGNGHVTRARVLAPELYEAGVEVDFIFSGRDPDRFFEMELFGTPHYCKGLTFHTHKGRVCYWRTVQELPVRQFIGDVRALDLSPYDLVLTDFEPITAWAAKLKNKPVVGIGHQYAFHYKIPIAGADPLVGHIMRYFAPAQTSIGLHWHHFDQPILPPIIETPPPPKSVNKRKVIVYLPFEESQDVLEVLRPFRHYEFHVYSPQPIVSDEAHIVFKPLSRQHFQEDLYDSVGIISNAGFELASESLQLGKKILAKPLHAQMEQKSNARALEELGYGQTMDELDPETIEEWLEDSHPVRVTYPNVAKAIVEWMLAGRPAITQAWIDQIWRPVEVIRSV